MKLLIIICLSAAVIVLAFSSLSLRQELTASQKNAAFYERRNEGLQRELMRLSRAYAETERFLGGIEQNISELESKIDLGTLDKYIPKKTWSEIKPIIDRLQALQQERESHNLSVEK